MTAKHDIKIVFVNLIKSTIYIASSATQDCRSIKQGSVNDSDVVEDYRKQKHQFGSPQTCEMKKVIRSIQQFIYFVSCFHCMDYSNLFILLLQRPRKINSVDRYGGLKGVVNGCNVHKGPSDNRPSKPRELLYSRHINQVDILFSIIT